MEWYPISPLCPESLPYAPARAVRCVARVGGGPIATMVLIVGIPAIVVSYAFLVMHIREVTASFAPASVTDRVIAAA